MDKEELEVLRSESAKMNYEYALNHPNCDVKAHGQVVIDSGEAWDNYIFARDIKGADIKAHGKVVINKGDAYTNYIFAREIKGADIKAHEEVVIDSGELYFNCEFAKNVPSANIMAHRKAIAKCGTKKELAEFDRELKELIHNSNDDREVNSAKIKNSAKNPYQFNYEELNNDELLNDLVQVNVSVFLHGPSGVGKSARVKQLDPTATRITLRPQMNPEEVDGTLNRETGEYIPPLWYTQLVEKCKSEPDRKHILFIDELTNVKPTVQSLVYSIVLDRAGKDGLWPLPENAVVVAAGNESKDNLAAYPLTNALYRRFSHIYYEVNKEDWLEWATKVNSSFEGKKIHPAIIAYIMSREDILNQELDEENPKIVTDPRKWEIASKVLTATKNPNALLPLIGEELTADFVEFVQEIQITPEDIVSGDYNEEDYKELSISQKYSTIAGLTTAQEGELALVRDFVGKNLGKELLATYDSLWIGNDPERAMIIGELRDNNKNVYREI